MAPKVAEASSPNLPDDATPEQLDAWIEVAELLNDDGFVETMRRNARQLAENPMDMQKLLEANRAVASTADEARAAGAKPESERGRSVVEAFAADIAAASGRENDERLRHAIYTRHTSPDVRAVRYAELMTIITGQTRMPGSADDWRFIGDAIRYHLASKS